MKLFSIVKINLFFWCIISYSCECYSQCETNDVVFKSGEVVSHDVYYNWGFIWLNAGYVSFEVRDSTYLGKDTHHLYSFGSSHKGYDWIFKVRDTYQSFVEKSTLLPLYFSRDIYEGGYEVNNKYSFDYSDQLIYTKTDNSKSVLKKDTLSMVPCVFDLLSVIYFARNQDYNNYQVNEKVPITVIIDGKIYDLYIRYLGKEVIKTRQGIKYNCIKFSPLLVEGTIFTGGEGMTVWVTDDQNRIPVLVEADILVGSIKSYLIEVKNLKYPQAALISD